MRSKSSFNKCNDLDLNYVGILSAIRARVRFLSSPGSCSLEVMPGTLRNICMSVSLSGFRQDLSAALLAHPQCLGVPWTGLCTGDSGFGALDDFWWAVPGLCVVGGKAAFSVFHLG